MFYVTVEDKTLSLMYSLVKPCIKTPVCTLLVYYDAIIYYMYEGIESEERSDLLNKRERERGEGDRVSEREKR